MIRFSTHSGRIAIAMLIACMLVLSGCHRGAARNDALDTKVQGNFDLVVKAYKSGQFMINGAVLTPLDAGSHFAYLKDAGKLPHTVLLEPSDDSKVRKQHLQYMARMELDYGFVAYYADGGVLTKIDPVDTHARALQDYHAPAKESEESRSRDASGGFQSQGRNGGGGGNGGGGNGGG